MQTFLEWGWKLLVHAIILVEWISGQSLLQCRASAINFARTATNCEGGSAGGFGSLIA